MLNCRNIVVSLKYRAREIIENNAVIEKENNPRMNVLRKSTYLRIITSVEYISVELTDK